MTLEQTEHKFIGKDLTTEKAIEAFRKNYTVATAAHGAILKLDPNCFNISVAKFLLLDKREGENWWAE